MTLAGNFDDGILVSHVSGRTSGRNKYHICKINGEKTICHVSSDGKTLTWFSPQRIRWINPTEFQEK